MKRIDPDQLNFIEIIYNRQGEVQVFKGCFKNPPNEIVCIKKVYVRDIDQFNIKNKECIAMAKLQHANIIKLIGAAYEGEKRKIDSLMMVMHYYPEGDLDKLIKKKIEENLRWSEPELLEYLRQTTSALAYMQKSNIAHRDIKPMNILVMNNGRTLIIGDLGSTTCITYQTMTIVGTPVYFSPSLRLAYAEHFRTGNTAFRHNAFKSDVYSLGAVFLYMTSLIDVKDLSLIDNLQNLIDQRINALSPSYNKMKYLLAVMMCVDENRRPDFIELEAILNQILLTPINNNPEPLEFCNGCQKEYNLDDFYCFNENKLCKVCAQTTERFPDKELVCIICMDFINATLECTCMADRCGICKNKKHSDISCYSSLESAFKNGCYNVRMRCPCDTHMELNEYYYTCQHCGNFCVVCGKSYDVPHPKCEFLMAFGYLDSSM